MLMNETQICVDLHHTAYFVEDVAEAMKRYELLLGLNGEMIGNKAVMRCMHEDFCLILQPAKDAMKGQLNYVAYELRPDMTLDDAQAEIKRRGESATKIDVPIRGSGLLLNDCDGNRVVLVERKLPEDSRPSIMIETQTLRGYHPRRLGHVNYLTADASRFFKWYSEILGFQLTDWIGSGACWMHVDARHHVLAVLEMGYSHIHHVAYELTDFGAMRDVLDHIAKHGRWVTWGPLRHGMAQNLASYWRMVEEEFFIELYCDMQVLTVDHEPVVHPDNAYSSNTWGQLPPRTYFRFDKEAIQHEKNQTYAYIDSYMGARPE